MKKRWFFILVLALIAQWSSAQEPVQLTMLPAILNPGKQSTAAAEPRSAVQWEPLLEFNGQLFPAWVLSTAGNSFELQKNTEPGYEGDPLGVLGIILRKPKPNTNITVVIDPTAYTNRAEHSVVIKEKLEEVKIYPKVSWNYEKLRALMMAIPIDFTFRISINGKVSVKTVTANIHSLDTCPLQFVDDSGDTFDLSILSAAFVNEGHPEIAAIREEIKSLNLSQKFVGLQHGPEVALAEVFSLWRWMRYRKYTYSNQTNTGQNSHAGGKVFSQRIRLFEDTKAQTQVNCIDGATFLASLVQSVDIPSTLVLTKNHAFLGFKLEPGDSASLFFLETTLVGDKAQSLSKEMLADPAIEHYRKALNKYFFPGRKDFNPEIDHFLFALVSGATTYATNSSEIRLVDINEARQYIRPIYRSAKAVQPTPEPRKPATLPFSLPHQQRSEVSFDQYTFYSSAPPLAKRYFAVHVSFFSRPEDFTSKFQSLNQYGKIAVEYADKKLPAYRVLITGIKTQEEARALASSLRKKGFKYAAVELYEYGNRKEILPLTQ